MKRWLTVLCSFLALMGLCFAFTACGEQKEETVCEHEYADNYTCHDRECIKCGEILPATTDHNFISSVKTDPTCTETGYTLQTCECGYTQKVDIVAALGHDFQKVSEVAATCTQPGKTEYKCSRCDATDTEYTPAEGHTPKAGEDVVVAPTCTERGYTRHTCEKCNTTYEDTYVPALGHSAEAGKDVVVEPTCTEGGYTEHVCSVCGETYRDTVTEALGHDFAVAEEEETATCEHAAYVIEECSRCHVQEVSVTQARTAHTFGADGKCESCGAYVTEANILNANLTGDGTAQLVKQDAKYGYVVYADPAGGGNIYQLNIDRATIDALVAQGYGRITANLGNPDSVPRAFSFGYKGALDNAINSMNTTYGFGSGGEFDIYLTEEDGSLCEYIDAKDGLNLLVAFHAFDRDADRFAIRLAFGKTADEADPATLVGVMGAQTAYDESTKTWTVTGIDPTEVGDYRLWIAEAAWKNAAGDHTAVSISLWAKEGQGIGFNYAPAEGTATAANQSVTFTVEVPADGDLSLLTLYMSHFTAGGAAPDGFKMKIEQAHELTELETVPPTCISEGYTQGMCKYSGKTEVLNTVPAVATAHKFVDGVCEYCGKSVTEAPIVSAYVVGGDGTAQPVEQREGFGYVIGVAPGSTYAVAIDRATIDALVAQGYGVAIYRFGSPDAAGRAFTWWVDGLDPQSGNNGTANGFTSFTEFTVRLTDENGALCDYITANGLYVYVQYGALAQGTELNSFGVSIAFEEAVTEDAATQVIVTGTETTYDESTKTWTITGIDLAKAGDYRVWIAKEALQAMAQGYTAVDIVLSAKDGQGISFNYAPAGGTPTAANQVLTIRADLTAGGDLVLATLYAGHFAAGGAAPDGFKVQITPVVA